MIFEGSLYPSKKLMSNDLIHFGSKITWSKCICPWSRCWRCFPGNTCFTWIFQVVLHFWCLVDQV